MRKQKYKESRFDKGFIRERKATEELIEVFKLANPKKEDETVEQYFARFMAYKEEVK